jgi:uncharacterized membrane protein YgaE (UPF0421/DUF939 family)
MLRVHRDSLDWRSAVVGTIVVMGILIAAVAYGRSGVAGAMGFVLTFLAWSRDEERSWRGMVAFAALGVAIGLVAFLAAEDVAMSSALLGVVSLLAALAAAGGGSQATRWSLLVLWALIALIVADPEAVASGGIGFAIGWLFALVLLRPRRQSEEGHIGGIGGWAHWTKWDTWWFAATKAIAVALSVPLGFLVVADTPYWVALTVIIVAQAGRDDTTQLAFRRAIGTFLGVTLGVVVVWLVPASDFWMTTALVAIVFGQMLFLKVNYVLYALFLTALVVVGSSLGEADVVDVAWSRLLATIIGVLVALGAILVAGRMAETGTSEDRV